MWTGCRAVFGHTATTPAPRQYEQSRWNTNQDLVARDPKHLGHGSRENGVLHVLHFPRAAIATSQNRGWEVLHRLCRFARKICPIGILLHPAWKASGVGDKCHTGCNFRRVRRQLSPSGSPYRAEKSNGRQPKPPGVVVNAMPQMLAPPFAQGGRLPPAAFDKSKDRYLRIGACTLVMR